MANLSPIASVGTGVTALSNLIMVSPQQVIGYQPQPYNTLAEQITTQTLPTLLFHYEGEQTVGLDSDITDHYVEDNTALQDQIALRPVTITTHGFIGELNDVAPKGLQTLKQIANKLGAISAYAPALSSTALIAYNEAFLAYQTALNALNAGVSAVSSLAGGDAAAGVVSLQQKYFQQFYGYWQGRFLFTVQTPWGIFGDCAIMSLKAVQDEVTNVITDFNITFKQLKFASTQTTAANTGVQGQLSAQSAPTTNTGTVQPADNGSTVVGSIESSGVGP